MKADPPDVVRASIRPPRARSIIRGRKPGRLDGPIPVILGLAVAIALVWGRSLGFAFVWDDHAFIQRLPAIRSFSNLPRFFYDINAQAVNGRLFCVFRPLRNIVYTGLCVLHGGRPVPWLFHLANLAGHFLVCVFLYFTVVNLLARLAPRLAAGNARFGAALAAFGFAVHPIDTEVVCWAKSLDDILATLFTLAACNWLLQWPRRRWGYVWALGFFVLALYSKVSAIPFALFVPAVLHWVHHRSLRENAARTAAFGLAAGVYLFHRYGVLGQMAQIAPLSGGRLATVADTVAYALPRYGRLLLGLPPFCIDYSFLKPGAPALELACGVAILACAGFLTVFLLRQERGVLRAVGLGLLWTGLFFLPVSNLVPMMQYLAQRFCYLPLAGAMAAFGAGAGWLAARRPHLRALFCLIPLAWGGTAAWVGACWKDDLTLFLMAGVHCTPSERVVTNTIRSAYGLPFMRAAFRRDVPAAAVPWERVQTTLDSLEHLYPHHPEIELGYAMAAWRRGNTDKAWKLLRRALRREPDQPHLVLAAVRIELERKQFAAARTGLIHALRLSPGSRRVYWVLAEYYRKVGQPGNAARLERKARGRRSGARARGGSGRDRERLAG